MLNKMIIDDLFSINAIEQQNPFPWTETMLRDSFRAGDEMWGIKIHNKVIGYACMRLACDEAEILNVAVDEDFRGQGYGKQLIQHMLNLAQQVGVRFVFLEVRISNSIAISLYERLGFTQIGKRKNYYQSKHENREDAYLYKLDLNQV